jgi:DNA-binding IclR family transcriptional regulator
LASWQLLRRTPEGRYQVGPNVLRLAGGAGVPDLEERALLVVSDLHEVTGRRARLGVLDGPRVGFVERRSAAEPATGFRAGATLPLHATALGKALLAFAPSQTVAQATRRLPAHTARTLTSPERLHRELHLIRRIGFARSRGEFLAGDHALAAPVFGPGGTVLAALELQVHDRRSDVDWCRGLLLVAARGLSRELSLPVDGRGYGGQRPQLRLLRGRPGGAGDQPSLRTGAAVLP